MTCPFSNHNNKGVGPYVMHMHNGRLTLGLNKGLLYCCIVLLYYYLNILTVLLTTLHLSIIRARRSFCTGCGII